MFKDLSIIAGCAFLAAACSTDVGNVVANSGAGTALSGNFGDTKSIGLEEFKSVGPCPKVRVIDGTQTLRVYLRGKDKDPFSLRYQAAITKTARDCRRSGDQLVMRVGVAGRLTPGPMGKAEIVRVPVRIALVAGGSEVLTSNLHLVELNVADPSKSGTWTKVDTNVSGPARDDLEVLVGFDYKEAKKRRLR